MSSMERTIRRNILRKRGLLKKTKYIAIRPGASANIESMVYSKNVAVKLTLREKIRRKLKDFFAWVRLCLD